MSEAHPVPAIIDRFTGDYDFLANFAACAVTFADVGEPVLRYRSVEHAFQAAKTLSVADRERLQRTESPLTAKQLGRRVVMRPDWPELRLRIMKDLLRQKFAVEPFRSRLLATGAAHLVEGNTWHDQFWGDCVCPGHADEPGENLLGILIMEIRQEVAWQPPVEPFNHERGATGIDLPVENRIG